LVPPLLAQLNVAVIKGADNDAFGAGFRLHRDRGDKTWSLTDYISFALMGQRGLRAALAYDHHFEQAGFEVLLRRDPE
jgi:uncharacterized protein